MNLRFEPTCLGAVGLVGYGQLILLELVDVGIRAQLWALLVEIVEKFAMHMLVLEERIGVF